MDINSNTNNEEIIDDESNNECDRLLKPSEPIIKEFYTDFHIKYSNDNINEIIEHMYKKRLFPYAVIMKCPYMIENFDTGMKTHVNHKESINGRYIYFNFGLNRTPIQKFVKVDNIINHENDMVIVDNDNINYKIIEYVFCLDVCGEYLGCANHKNNITNTSRIIRALGNSTSEDNFNYYYGGLLRYSLMCNDFHCKMNKNESLKVLDKFEFYIIPIEFHKIITNESNLCMQNIQKTEYVSGKIRPDKLIHIMI